jgi:hypothetical protein
MHFRCFRWFPLDTLSPSAKTNPQPKVSSAMPYSSAHDSLRTCAASNKGHHAVERDASCSPAGCLHPCPLTNQRPNNQTNYMQKIHCNRYTALLGTLASMFALSVFGQANGKLQIHFMDVDQGTEPS